MCHKHYLLIEAHDKVVVAEKSITKQHVKC